MRSSSPALHHHGGLAVCGADAHTGPERSARESRTGDYEHHAVARRARAGMVMSGGTVVWQWHMGDHTIQDYDNTEANDGVVSDHPELIGISGPAS